MIDPAEVSAVLVTRGDVDLSRILETIGEAGIADVVIWDNAEREDLKTFGRYAALPEAKHDIVFFQDDDIVLPPDTIQGIIAAYEPGVICANMAPGWVSGRDLHDSVFVGAGGVLDRDLPDKAFAKYDRLYPRDEVFYLYPEAMVSIPSRIKRVDLPLEVLPWGYAPNRMVSQPWFEDRMAESIRRGRKVRDTCTG
jgi:glycosyltransferase involved in cell wall biosynthesis